MQRGMSKQAKHQCWYTLVLSFSLNWWCWPQHGDWRWGCWTSGPVSSLCPHTFSFSGRMTCHPNAPLPQRRSMLMHPHQRTTPSPPPTPTIAASGMTPKLTTSQTPSPASATAMMLTSLPSPAQGARVPDPSMPMAATHPRLPLRHWWWRPARHRRLRRWSGAMVQSAGNHGCRTPVPMQSARPRWSGSGLSLSWCPPRAGLAPWCSTLLVAELSKGPIIPGGVKRLYSFLKGSEVAGFTHLPPAALPSRGCFQLVGQPCPSHFPSSCWSSSSQWTPQMCQGQRSREVRTCSWAAGSQVGHVLRPDLGGNFCFYFLFILLGTNSIHLGLSGRYGIYTYIFFFLLLLLVFFPRGWWPV